ncbi:heterokaryon incompatibility protein-domain-containing protein [Cubamyces menziesii]|nr:heterokaryon incompatibility protein-domain-containing protein [Cubamyces menziesii]
MISSVLDSIDHHPDSDVAYANRDFQYVASLPTPYDTVELLQDEETPLDARPLCPQPIEVPQNIVSPDGPADPAPAHAALHLPFSRAELPPRPDNACSRCWDGVIAARLGLWSDPVQEVQDGTGGHRWTGGYTYTISAADSDACENSGCCWGIFINREAYRADNKFGPPLPWHLRVGTPYSLGPGKIEDIVVVLNNEKLAVFQVLAHRDDPAAAWIKGRTRNPVIARPDVLSMAKSLIDDCTQTHEDCRAFSDLAGPPSCPSRLIDCSDPLRPYIVDATGLEPHVRYVALSYVWGEDQPHRTTVENLPKYSKQIDLSLLPQTIHDAIHVTRNVLGIQYLWVDSLCIIQDSREDKHRELAKMREVYLHAFLTIDAGNARRASQGFLHDGDPLTSGVPFICPRHFEEDVLEIGSVHTTPNSSFVIQCGYPSLDMSNLRDLVSTAGRAWCLQEVLLSKRRLLFTDLDLQFWCRSDIQHPGGPHLTYYNFDHPWHVTGIAEIVSQHSSVPIVSGSGEWARVHRTWQTIVQDYTSRSLSYPLDRLVACAGIAELFGRVLRSDYLAGLWKNCLLFDLLWCRGGVFDEEDGDDTAPSWSWATRGQRGVKYCIGDGAHMSGVYTEERTCEMLAEIMDCGVTLSDPALPFGRVQGGFITLRAPLHGPYQRRVEPRSDRHDTVVSQVNGIDLKPTVNHRDVQGRKRADVNAGGEAFFDCYDCGEMEAIMDRDFKDEELRNLWLVPLIYQFESELLECLVVAEVELDTGCMSDRRGREFRRIGYWGWDNIYEIDSKLVENLLRKVDGQWAYPRSEILLV